MPEQLNILHKIIRKASSNRKLYVFLLCLSLSFLFWILNALSKTSTTQVLFDVNYVNQPKDKIVLNKLPQQITIKIKGLGYDLIAYKLRLRRPVVKVDLSKVNGFNTKMSSATLPSSSFANYITNQLGDRIEVKNIYPDSIRFLFDERAEKLVEIIPLTQLKFKQQYRLQSKIIVKPAVTKVVGPASVLDTLNRVYTQQLNLVGLSETTTQSIGFNKGYEIKKISFNPDKVILHLPIEKFTESSVMVKITPVNVPDSLEIKSIPNEVELKFLIPLSKIVSLQRATFSAKIDYKQISDNFNHKLKVELTDYPSYIESFTLNPAKVEYILKKRK